MVNRSSRLRLGVLVSGRGSNLQAILDSIDLGELPAEVVIVVSNRREAGAIERALRHGVEVVVLERKGHASNEKHQLAIGDVLHRRAVDLVVLAGFDRILCPAFLRNFAGRIINIHPSLLPAFGGGLHAQADALNYGARVSGCTVHFVTEEVDAGPIIVQRAVPVLDDDDADTLAERILAEEHKALPEAIRLFAAGRLAVEGRRVRLLPDSHEAPRLS